MEKLKNYSETELLIDWNKLQKEINIILKNKDIFKLDIEELRNLYKINSKVIDIINYYKTKEFNNDKFTNSLLLFLEKNNDIFWYFSKWYDPTLFIFKVWFLTNIDNDEELEKNMTQYKNLAILDLLKIKEEIENKLEDFSNTQELDQNKIEEIKLLVAQFFTIREEFKWDIISHNYDIKNNIESRYKTVKQEEHINKIDSEVKLWNRNITWIDNTEKDCLNELKINEPDNYKKLVYDFEFNTQKNWIYINEIFLDRTDFFESIKNVKNTGHGFRSLNNEYDIPQEFLSHFYKQLHHTFWKEFLIKLFKLDPNIFWEKSSLFD